MEVFSIEEILPNYGEGGDPTFCKVLIRILGFAAMEVFATVLKRSP